MTAVNWARLLLVCTVAFLLQVALVDQVVVAGVHADVMVLLAVAAGLSSGPQRGAVAGFVLGLFADLVVPTPYGLSSLTFVLVGFAAGLVRGDSDRGDTFFGRGVLCLIGGAVGTLAYAVLAALIGQPGMLGGATFEATLIVGLGGLVLAWPAVWAMDWALALAQSIGDRRSVPSGGSAT